jgi:hypothetical protein
VTVMAGLPVIFPGVIWQGCAPRRFHTGKTPGKLFAMRCIPRARAPGKFTGKSAFPRAFSQFPGDLPPWNDQYSCSELLLFYKFIFRSTHTRYRTF